MLICLFVKLNHPVYWTAKGVLKQVLNSYQRLEWEKKSRDDSTPPSANISNLLISLRLNLPWTIYWMRYILIPPLH